MTEIVLFNKPYGVLSQFLDHDGHPGLKRYISLPDIYPMGRLDRDSEGLLLLSGDGQLQARIADPRHKMEKTYVVQLEGEITPSALEHLAAGVTLNDGMTRPAKAKSIQVPNFWLRNPPVRERKQQPTCWVELKITEGRNRQVRRMTAAVGYPTLRLIRTAIGPWQLGDIQPGSFSKATVNLPQPAKTVRRGGKGSSSRKPRFAR